MAEESLVLEKFGYLNNNLGAGRTKGAHIGNGEPQTIADDAGTASWPRGAAS
jgi:hypothetical protein